MDFRRSRRRSLSQIRALVAQIKWWKLGAVVLGLALISATVVGLTVWAVVSLLAPGELVQPLVTPDGAGKTYSLRALRTAAQRHLLASGELQLDRRAVVTVDEASMARHLRPDGCCVASGVTVAIASDLLLYGGAKGTRTPDPHTASSGQDAVIRQDRLQMVV